MKAALLLTIARGLSRVTVELAPEALRALLGIVAQGFEEFSDALVKEREREKVEDREREKAEEPLGLSTLRMRVTDLEDDVSAMKLAAHRGGAAQ